MCQRYVYRVLLQAGRLRPRQRRAEKLAGPCWRAAAPSTACARAKPGARPSRWTESLPAPSGLTPEDRLALQEALARLSPVEAELIRLQYFEGYTPKEIAERLGLPYETVKKRRQRALARLRKSLLATLILVLPGPAGGLRLCGAAVLRHSAGVRRQHRRRNAVLYPGRGKRPAKTTLAAVEITDAVLADGAAFGCRSC